MDFSIVFNIANLSAFARYSFTALLFAYDRGKREWKYAPTFEKEADKSYTNKIKIIVFQIKSIERNWEMPIAYNSIFRLNVLKWVVLYNLIDIFRPFWCHILQDILLNEHNENCLKSLFSKYIHWQ